jgi:hypothetical protein
MGDEASDEGRCVLRRVETGRHGDTETQDELMGLGLGFVNYPFPGARCIAQMAADVVIAISILNAG